MRVALDLLAQPIPVRRFVGDRRPLRRVLPMGNVLLGTWGATWKALFETSLHPDRASAIAFSPVSDHLLIGTAGGLVHWMSSSESADPLLLVGAEPVLDVEVAEDASFLTVLFQHTGVRRWPIA